MNDENTTEEKIRKPRTPQPITVITAVDNGIEMVTVRGKDELKEYIEDNGCKFDESGLGTDSAGNEFVMFKGKMVTPKVTSKISYS